MPVQYNKKVIFIHIPKTGGQSIYEPLEMRGGPNTYSGYQQAHLTANELRNVLGTKMFNSYTKLSVVRNPYDRLVSEYFYIQQRMSSGSGGYIKELKGHDVSFEDLVKNLAKIDLYEHPQCQRARFLPQKEFIYSNDALVVDKLFRFENWQEIEKYMKENYNSDIPHKNKSEHDSYMHYYNPETLAIVNDLYKEDFKAFDYQIMY